MKQVWTTHNQPSPTPLRRWQQSELGDSRVVATEDETVVGVEGLGGKLDHPPAPPPTTLPAPDTPAPSIPTSLPVSGQGAACTSGGGAKVISAVNQRPAPGRIFMLKNHRNEPGTNSATLQILIKLTMTC